MMFRNLLLGAVALTALAACNDRDVTAPAPAVAPPNTPKTPVEPALSLLRGTLEVSVGDRLLWLRQDDNSAIRLFDSDQSPLYNVAGAQVEVKGTYDAGPGMAVASFLVLSVHGLQAWDGVLVEMEGAYALRMTDGALHMLTDPPADLITNVGARVWVTRGDDGTLAEFGVIAAQ